MTFVERHRRDILMALGIFALALVLRVLFVVWLHPDIPGEPKLAKDDSWFYRYSAASLIDGEGYIHPYRLAPTADHPPAYTLLLAGAYLLPGEDMLNARLFNAAVGAAGCSLLFVAGRLLAQRAAGIAAGLLLTFFPSHIFYSTLPITEVTYSTAVTVVVLLFILALVRRPAIGWRFPILLGLALGAATMVRGEAVLLFLVFGGVWWFATRSLRQALQFTSLVVLGLAIVISAWTIRNQIQVGAPIPISTGSAVLLSISHWEGANGGGDLIRGIAVTFYYDDLPYPEREVKAYRKQTRDALHYAVTHPGRELSLIPRRVLYLYEDDHTAADWVAHYKLPVGKATIDRLRAVSDAYYYATGLLSLAGVWLWWRSRREAALLLAGSVFYLTALMGIVFFGTPRYHAGIIPVLCLLAGPALVALKERGGGALRALRAVRGASGA